MAQKPQWMRLIMQYSLRWTDGKRLLEEQGRGADVILGTSNSYKATVDSIKGLRPDGRLFWWEHQQQTNLLYFLQGRFLEFLFKRDRVIGSTQNVSL